MILGLHHTAIATRDLDRLEGFYTKVMGLTKISEARWSGDAMIDATVGLKNSAARFIFLSAGNQCLEIFEYSSPEPKPGNPDRPVSDVGLTHLCFAVRDILAEYERLSAAGMRFHAPPTIVKDWPLCATYGRDPDGNVIELLELYRDHEFNYSPTTPSWTG